MNFLQKILNLTFNRRNAQAVAHRLPAAQAAANARQMTAIAQQTASAQAIADMSQAVLKNSIPFNPNANSSIVQAQEALSQDAIRVQQLAMAQQKATLAQSNANIKQAEVVRSNNVVDKVNAQMEAAKVQKDATEKQLAVSSAVALAASSLSVVVNPNDVTRPKNNFFMPNPMVKTDTNPFKVPDHIPFNPNANSKWERVGMTLQSHVQQAANGNPFLNQDNNRTTIQVQQRLQAQQEQQRLQLLREARTPRPRTIDESNLLIGESLNSIDSGFKPIKNPNTYEKERFILRFKGMEQGQLFKNVRSADEAQSVGRNYEALYAPYKSTDDTYNFVLSRIAK